MIIDLLLLALLFVALIRGFKTGFIPSVLALLGYLGGGIIGLLVAKEISGDWTGITSRIILFVAVIFVAAQVGQRLARTVGRGFRSLIGPLKIFDGLLGAFFASLKMLLVFYFLFSIISITEWKTGLSFLESSRVAHEVSIRVPESLTRVFTEIKGQIRQ